MLTFITESNLFARRGAFLPPSLPNMGTGYVAGSLREHGVQFDLVPWFELYLSALCVDAAPRTIAAVSRLGERHAGFLHEILTRGGERALAQYLRRAHQLATSRSLVDYLAEEHVRLLLAVLRDLYHLQIALLDTPSDLGVPAVDVFVRRCRELGHAKVAVSAQTLHEPLTRALVRALAKDHEVILGGSLTSTQSPESLRRTCFDDGGATWLLRGNADGTLPALLRGLEGASGLTGIDGLMGRIDGGRFLMGEKLPNPTSEEIAMPDFSGCDLHGYYFPWPMLPLQTGRGCYWKRCAFCRQEIYGKTYRSAPVEHLVSTLRYYRRELGVRHVMLSDEALPPDHAGEIARALRAEPEVFGDMRFCAAARPEAAFDAERLELLVSAGLKLVFWGLESGSQASLDRMDKGTRVHDVSRLLERSARAGLSNLCFVLVGFPGETEAQALETVRFLADHASHIDYFRINPFHLEPGTRTYRAPHKYGLTVVGGDEILGSFDYHVAEGVTSEQARALAARIDAGEWGSLRSARFLPLPTLGFGEEPMLFYFLQRVVGLEVAQPDGEAQPDVAGERRPVALVTFTRDGGKRGVLLGGDFHPLDEGEVATLRRMDGTARVADLTQGNDDTAVHALLDRLRLSGKLAWVRDPGGSAE